jgi:alpha-amylase
MKVKFVLALIFVFAETAAIAVPIWRHGATGYQIFVHSFQDSDGDGIGDLQGIIARLDYLNSGQPDDDTLGIQAIWLTPIFGSPSDHGYDTTNYKAIKPVYGSMADFDALIAAAHLRGIKIILDFAVNHTSDRHPWFQDAVSAVGSTYRDWYVWRSRKPTWGHWYQIDDQFYYSVYHWNMPSLNWQNPKIVDEIINILRFWIARGVDGFRLDAARHYVPGPNGESDTPETHARIAQFTSAIRQEFPDVFFIGEIWADAQTIASYVNNGTEVDLAYNFPLAFDLIPTINSEQLESFESALRSYVKAFDDQHTSAPFLTNHDISRVASRLWGYKPKVKLAAEVYFMLPGLPFVYYGDEIGMVNIANDDSQRAPMQWTTDAGYGFTAPDVRPWRDFLGNGQNYSVEAQSSQPDGLLAVYKRLIRFRAANIAVAAGTLHDIERFDGERVMTWKRTYQGTSVLVAVNFGYQPSRPIATKQSLTVQVYPQRSSVPVQSQIPSLPPHSVRVFELH